MEKLPRLPARVPPLPGESLQSLYRRHALAMGYERAGLLSAVLSGPGQRSAHLNHVTPGQELQALSQLFGLSTTQLQTLTVHTFAPQLVFVARGEPAPASCDSKTVRRFFHSSSRPICPLCLQANPPYERLVWSFRPAPVCLAHHCLLVPHCPACRRALRPGRLDARRCRCGFDLRRGRAEPVPDDVLRLTEPVLGALTAGEPLLPEMSVAASFWWAERLMSAARKTEGWLQQLRERHALGEECVEASVAWLAAAEILSHWPDRFEQFLDLFQTVTKHRTTDTGLSRSFGMLLRDAAHLEQSAFGLPADQLRGYLLQRYTRGHLNSKVCLFKTAEHRRLVAQRPWLTQTDAARRLGLRQGAIADLVQRGLLEGEVRPAGRRGRSVGVVSRTSVERLGHQLASAVSAKQAADRLGISRHRVLELIHAGLLTRAVRTNRGWRIPAPSVELLMEEYHALPVLKPERPEWLSHRQATRRYGRCGLTFVRLIELLHSGSIRARRLVESGDWRGLAVHRGDLELARPEIRQRRQAARGYSLHHLGRELIPGRPLKDSVLRKWIRAGLLHAERRDRVWNVSPDEVARFRATYCLAAEACRVLSVTRSTLSRWEATGRIVSVYSRRTHSGAGASVFLRDDVHRLHALRRGAAVSD